MSYFQNHIFICNNKRETSICCSREDTSNILSHMKKYLRKLESTNVRSIRVSSSGCLGRCSQGPILVIYPEGIWYRYESIQDIEEILDTHFTLKKVVKHLAIDPTHQLISG